MNVPCCLLVLLTWTRSVAVVSLAEQDSQIERPKELLRHQQNHRPSFIDRKLDMHEATLPPDDLRDPEDASSAEDDSSQVIHRSKPETSIEKPATQIRHGRSRNHFARQLQLDEQDFGYMPAGPSRRSQPTDNVSRIEDGPQGPEKPKVKSPGYEEVPGFKPSGSIDERSTVDLDKLLIRLSEAGKKEGKPRNTPSTKHKSDAFNKLRKVTTRNRSRLSGNRTTGNLTEIYGHIVHGAPTVDRSELNDEELAILEEYDMYIEKYGGNGSESEDYDDYGKATVDRGKATKEPVHVDIVTRFLRIIENQHLLGENCTAGTDLNQAVEVRAGGDALLRVSAARQRPVHGRVRRGHIRRRQLLR